MKVNCIIIEDFALERELLAGFISKIGFLELKGSFSNALEARNYIVSNEDIDLIISDIMLPGIDGIALIKTLPKPPMVIFTTSSPDYAVDGFALNATDYLVKPIKFNRFETAINRAYKQMELKAIQGSEHMDPKIIENDHFFIRSDHSFIRIKYADLVYIEGKKDYVRVVTTGNNYMTAMNLKVIEEKLPVSNFIRIHKSFMVNIAKIESINNFELTAGGVSLPVGKEYKEKLFNLVVGNNIIRR
jgi:DNA-binding LytR/AlgR family response regulator